MPRPPRVLSCCAATLLAASAGRASADDYIPISGAAFKPLPLAVAPFQGTAPHAAALNAALREDLLYTGLFELLDPRSFLADAREGLASSSVDYSKWRAVGADSLVKASLSGTGAALTAEMRLFDVVGGKEAKRASYSGTVSELREWAHRFADVIYENFTGEKGIFRTKIVFTRRSPGSRQLWTSDVDGRGAVQVTSGSGLEILPAWSPDGRTVVFTSYRTGSPMLHLLDVGTRAAKPMWPHGDLQTGGAFSPDGKRIAFTMSEGGNSDVWVAGADGTGLRQVTDSRESDSSPSWSPDGKRIAFVSTRSGGPQIFVMNADGSGVDRLTFQGNYNQTPDWSPRGDVVAFTARDERNVFDLFLVQVSTKKIQRLTQDQGNNEEPSFSPNGRHIVFASTRDGRKRLYMMNADGTNQRALASDGEGDTPAWGPWPE